jgi:hypothetical protein
MATGDPVADPATAAATLASALVGLTQSIGPMLEAAAGYRQQCEQAGFSPAAAEQMAVEYHRTLLTFIGGKGGAR